MFSSPKSLFESARSQQTPTEFYDFDNQTGRSPLEVAEEARDSALGVWVFWRTFFLLALLLIGSILAWLQTLRSLEFEPRIQQTAQQLASQVNLSRAALVHAGQSRPALALPGADGVLRLHGLEAAPRRA